MKAKIIGIIPSRYASTRFPAKSLAQIKGKSMIRRVYEQAIQAESLSKVVVATDHELIYKEVRSFGGEVMMTDPNHLTGTGRCCEVLDQHSGFDFAMNIQGDEPFIKPAQIDLLANTVLDTEIATLANQIKISEEIFDPNVVKVVCNVKQEALYFSRNPIPFQRNIETKDWIKSNFHLKHLGIYAFRADILQKITNLETSFLEKLESLEQLTWLFEGYKIKVAVSEHASYGIDTPEDVEKVLRLLGNEIF